MRKRIFFDTNVCGKVAASLLRETFLGRVRSEFAIWASTHTLMELLMGVCNSRSEHLPEHQERIRIAIGTSDARKARVLDSPTVSAFQEGIGLSLKTAGIQKLKYEKLVKIALAAKTLEELLEHGVSLPNSIKAWNMNCAGIHADLEEGKARYSETLNSAKREKWYLDEQRQWTITICHLRGVELSDAQVPRMVTALDAVYRYQESVWQLSLNTSFKPENNMTDWIDMNQVYHLADPTMHFLTEDEKIRARCTKSASSRRVLLLREYLEANALTL